MYKVRKKSLIIKAYKLGEDDDKLKEFIERKEIILLDANRYEIRSKEANKHGEIAYKGDYIKLDEENDIYPNSKEFFESNHRHIKEEYYEQVSKTLYAWDVNEPVDKETSGIIHFLEKHKEFRINESSMEARLWGTLEKSPIDSIVVFYDISYEGDIIKDIDFNFVTRSIFDQTYEVVN